MVDLNRELEKVREDEASRVVILSPPDAPEEWYCPRCSKKQASPGGSTSPTCPNESCYQTRLVKLK